MRRRSIRRRMAMVRMWASDWWSLSESQRWPRPGKEGVLSKWGACSCWACRGEKFRDKRQATEARMARYGER